MAKIHQLQPGCCRKAILTGRVAAGRMLLVSKPISASTSDSHHFGSGYAGLLAHPSGSNVESTPHRQSRNRIKLSSQGCQRGLCRKLELSANRTWKVRFTLTRPHTAEKTTASISPAHTQKATDTQTNQPKPRYKSELQGAVKRQRAKPSI